jgi:CDGSH-type Zn-finger protein
MSATPATITIINNGPIRIEGAFTLLDAQGNTFDTTGKERISLCRCGQSQKLPFCDGTHKTCGFVSEVVAPPPAA